METQYPILFTFTQENRVNLEKFIKNYNIDTNLTCKFYHEIFEIIKCRIGHVCKNELCFSLILNVLNFFSTLQDENLICATLLICSLKVRNRILFESYDSLIVKYCLYLGANPNFCIGNMSAVFSIFDPHTDDYRYAYMNLKNASSSLSPNTIQRLKYFLEYGLDVNKTKPKPAIEFFKWSDVLQNICLNLKES